MKSLNQPLTRKTAIVYVVALAALLVVLYSGWTLWGRLTGRPPSTAEVKRSIWRYLKKETGASDFSNTFASVSLTDVTTEPTITNKAGKVRKIVKSKRGEMDLPETGLTMHFRSNHAAAATYKEMYQLIGQQLAIADQLLEAGSLHKKQSGLVMASEASAYARNSAMNLWLAARICEGYLWPHLSLVEGTNKAPFTPDALLNLCDISFKEAGETNNIIRNYEYLIAKTVRPQQADAARFRLAQIYIEIEQEEKALALLKQITSFKNNRVNQEIARLEQRLKEKSK